MRKIFLLFQNIFGNKEAEKALKESEQKRRAIFDQALGLVGLMTPDGTLLEVNKAALEFSGIEASSVLNKPFWDTPWWAHSEELRAKLLEAVKKAANGEFSHFEAIHYDKDKNWCYMDFFLRPVKDKDGKVIFLISMGNDITHYKKMEETLRLDNEVIRKINEGVVYILSNIHIIFFANDSFSEMFGYKPGELYGKYAGILFPPIGDETPEQVYRRVVETLNRHKIWKGELRNIRKDGATFYSQTSIIPVNSATHGNIWVGIYTDITERKKAEQTLMESEQRCKTIFDQTFEFIGLMTPDGILIQANKAALEFSGIEASSVLNKPFWDTPWWAHSKELQAKLKEAVKKSAKGEFVRFEVTHYNKDKTLCRIDFSLKPVKDESGKVIFLIPEGRHISNHSKT